MIGKLTGAVDTVATDHLIVDCNGVGYVVFCSARTLRRIEGTGARVSLRVETQVREDAITLFGFADHAERDWFKVLTTVQGVGARVALAILSVLEPDRLTQAIAAQDKGALAQADGVGPKLAARIVNELKDKVADLRIGPAALAMGGPAGGGAAAAAVEPAGGAAADAVSALVNLGYKRVDAFTAVATAARRIGDAATVQDLIRAGLKELSA
jgi:Holliday junction DNA helicase RuvA